MKKLFKKALVIILTTALFYDIAPQYFYNISSYYAKAAANKTAAKITVKPGTKTLYIGWKEKKKTTSLKVTYKNVKNKSVSFKSSNKKVLKVSKKGKVTAIKAGNAYITATLKENKNVSAKVKINVKNY